MQNNKKRRRKKKKSRALPVILIIILVLAGAVAGLYFLGFWGIENGKKHIGRDSHEEVDQTPVAYITYLSAYAYVNKDGYMLTAVDTRPEDMPEIKDFEFTALSEGEKLECANQATFEYALKVIKDLNIYSLKMDNVCAFEETELVMNAGKVKIMLGENNRTDEKISDLSNFYDQIEGLDGTLDMKQISDNNLGYTFKINK